MNDPRTSNPPRRARAEDTSDPDTNAERPKPLAAPPERPRVKIGGVVLVFCFLFGAYFSINVAATLTAIALADRWWK